MRSATPCESVPGSARGDVHPHRPQDVRALLRLTAPIHPVLVHFAIGLSVSAFCFDLLAFVFGIRAWMTIGWWILAAAVPATLGALVTGVSSRMRLPLEEGEARSFLRTHMALGPLLFGLLVMLAFWRARLWQSTGGGVDATYLGAMFVVLSGLAVQGYLGGELVYRYGAGVCAHVRELTAHGAQAKGPARTGHRMCARC